MKVGSKRASTRSSRAPGSYVASLDRIGTFRALAASMPRDAVFVVDRRVARLHPNVAHFVKDRSHLLVTAGEQAKSVEVLSNILSVSSTLSRSGTMVAIEGGTVGDVTTVAAHLLKRGVRLVQVPTTLLAAVDSSLGGKGAIDTPHGKHLLKNGAGVFHYASETWIVPDLFRTLGGARIREGLTEAWKMLVCLDPKRYAFHARPGRVTSLLNMVREARALKARVCGADPYEQHGVREVLNFGHTFGHVFEAISQFRVSHGDAVGLGMRCALDVGVEVGVTPRFLAAEIEQTLEAKVGILKRSRLRAVLQKASDDQVCKLLEADKKNRIPGQTRMILLRRVGDAILSDVPPKEIRVCLQRWREGVLR